MLLRSIAITFIAASVFTSGCASSPEEESGEDLGAATEKASLEQISLDLDQLEPCDLNTPESMACSNRPHLPSVRNAYFMALMSKLAYDAKDRPANVDSDAFRRSELSRLFRKPINALDYRAFDAEGMQAFYVGTDEFGIVAFRGTEPREWSDIKADLRAVKHKAWVGSTHAGFDDATTAIWETAGLRSFLADRHYYDHATDYKKDRKGDRKARPLFVTGHSLGAAMATVATVHALTDGCVQREREIEASTMSEEAKRRAFADPEFLSCKNKKIPVHSLITFGSPRVGDRKFAEWFGSEALSHRVNLHRFVNNEDIVARVPISIGLGLYNHIGLEEWGSDTQNAFLALIDKAGQLKVGRDVEQGHGRSVLDHSSAAYVEKTKALASAELKR